MLFAYSDGTVPLHMEKLTVIEDVNKPVKRVSVFQHSKTSAHLHYEMTVNVHSSARQLLAHSMLLKCQYWLTWIKCCVYYTNNVAGRMITDDAFSVENISSHDINMSEAVSTVDTGTNFPIRFRVSPWQIERAQCLFRAFWIIIICSCFFSSVYSEITNSSTHTHTHMVLSICSI